MKAASSDQPSQKAKFRRGAQRRARERARLIRNAVIIGGLVVLAAAAVILFIANQPAGTGDLQGVKVFPNPERGHSVEPVSYAQTPPVGGVHHPAWQNCGVYTEPVPDENAVHSLEHGVIWITYQPDLPAEQVSQLAELTRQSGYRLLSPYPGIESPIVASAWGYQLALESADDPRLMDFIRKYEQNPLGPEPGASCSGGVGVPG